VGTRERAAAQILTRRFSRLRRVEESTKEIRGEREEGGDCSRRFVSAKEVELA